MARRGSGVLAVDVDPQNALRFHFQVPPGDSRGLAVETLRGNSWHDALHYGHFGVDCLPYGTVTEQDRRRFEQHLNSQPGWLNAGLGQLGIQGDCVILVDTPPGPSVYMQQVLTTADLVLVTLLPDAGSFATVAAMEMLLDEYCRPRPEFLGAYFLVNQIDSGRALSRDVLAMLKSRMGDEMCPHTIHFDAAVEEALASQQTVLEYAPDSAATHDIEQVAAWLDEKL